MITGPLAPKAGSHADITSLFIFNISISERTSLHTSGQTHGIYFATKGGAGGAGRLGDTVAVAVTTWTYSEPTVM